MPAEGVECDSGRCGMRKRKVWNVVAEGVECASGGGCASGRCGLCNRKMWNVQAEDVE